jgi:ferredoxin
LLYELGVLDEGKQLQLSTIIPFGTNITKEQNDLRKTIRDQQQELYKLNNSNLGVTSESNLRNSDIQDKISKFLVDLKVSRFGFTQIESQYTFQNSVIHSSEISAIVFVIPMDYNIMQSVPSIESATEIHKVYSEVGNVVVKLTKYLRYNGIQATGHHPLGDINEYHHILMPPHAVGAGLGEKGRTGLFIDHKLGPMVRLGIVTTNLQFDYNEPVDRGINAFCHRCRYCVPHCPPQAIPRDKYLESLQLGKPIIFTIDGNKCIKYFTKHYGCAKCIVKCVLAQPNAKELEKRLERIEIWYNRWVKSGELLKMQNKELKVRSNDF